MSKKHLNTYQGDQADVSWHGGLCIHIGECGRAEGDLFEGGRDPWCQPNLVELSNVLDVIERCPTGALSYAQKDGGASETADAENVVNVSYRGPLFIRGELAVDGADDEMPGTQYRVALCRCGASKNKPFCDNSHIEANFDDNGAVGQAGKGYEAPGGELSIARIKDGPLMLKGNFAIVNGSGRVAYRGTQAALCRCGESKNKPFCDGSHKAAGFTAE